MTTLLFHDPPAALRNSNMLPLLESAVEEAFRGEELGVVRVRFVRSDTADQPQYLCQVYSGPIGVFLGGPTWVWWSSGFERPEELRSQLRVALRLRRQQACDPLRPAPAQPARPAAAN
jgi:hypothetical protein